MSTIKCTTIQNLSGVEVYTAKAWVNFNGTGTVAIRASGNVSSITDNGTGDYTVNFTTAMTDANYSAVVTGRRGDGINDDLCFGLYRGGTYTSSACRIFNKVATVNNTYVDGDIMNVVIFR